MISNEILLILSVFVIYGCEILMFKLFGKQGLYCFTPIATIAANIEVLILINAYGIEMTLGNVLFSSTFLCTDILSEIYGKESAKKAVFIGVCSSLLFLTFSQLWLLFTPSENDFAMTSMQTIFSNTPRLMMASLVVYAIVQVIDVWLYHAWWKLTQKLTGKHRSFLWLRNNGSTMISQLANTILYTIFAFWGVYPNETIWQIIISSYAIFFIISLIDTPFIYFARIIGEKKKFVYSEEV